MTSFPSSILANAEDDNTSVASAESASVCLTIFLMLRVIIQSFCSRFFYRLRRKRQGTTPVWIQPVSASSSPPLRPRLSECDPADTLRRYVVHHSKIWFVFCHSDHEFDFCCELSSGCGKPSSSLLLPHEKLCYG